MGKGIQFEGEEHPILGMFKAATWNVRGLTDVKLQEIMIHMRKLGIDILCLQETHINKTEAYTENGFQVILSGADSEDRSWAGVGFVVAPHFRSKVKSYKQVSDRLATIKVRSPAGAVGIVNGYAPHNGKPLDERLNFYVSLDQTFRTLSVNSHKLIVGDLNARLGRAHPGEDEIIGPWHFGQEAVGEVEVPNRDLLVEFCYATDLIVANTFKNVVEEEKVTYMEPGSAPMGPVTSKKYAMLDLILCDGKSLDDLKELKSNRAATLATDHFLVAFVVNCRGGEAFQRASKRSKKKKHIERARD